MYMGIFPFRKLSNKPGRSSARKVFIKRKQKWTKMHECACARAHSETHARANSESQEGKRQVF